MGILDLNTRDEKTYTVHLNENAQIEGILFCLLNFDYSGASLVDIWREIIGHSGVNDGIAYIIKVTTGGKSLTYVGKTLGTFQSRYSNDVNRVTGGLSLVLGQYREGASTLTCKLYNVSHPALVEGWCYQILLERGYDLANKQDPS